MSNMKVTPVNCPTLLKTKNVEKYITESVDGMIVLIFKNIYLI